MKNLITAIIENQCRVFVERMARDLKLPGDPMSYGAASQGDINAALEIKTLLLDDEDNVQLLEMFGPTMTGKFGARLPGGYTSMADSFGAAVLLETLRVWELKSEARNE